MKLAPLAAALVVACTTSAPPPVAETPPPAVSAPAPWVDSVLSTMTLRDKAAQLVWPWMLGDYVASGTDAWQKFEKYVTEDHVGGFIISVGSPTEIAYKLNTLQGKSSVPLLVGADFETGAGFRARGGYFLPNAIDLGGATMFPLQMALGAARDTALAYQQGRVTALEGRAMGVHLSFGPVLDVNNNPANPVIGARSFGEDPALASRLGRAYVRGVDENGMLATGKHFPGHGDTDVNSHLALARIPASRARLDTVELRPFRAAIDAGLQTIMTCHCDVPALDPAGVPATLSPKVMTSLLRDELGFKGLLITDAMDMRGVLEQMGPAEVMKKAIEAGADVLLMPADIPGAIDAVVAGVREGRFTEARLDASVRKLLEYKKMMGLDRNRFVDLTDMHRVVGDPSHVNVARTIAERAITLVKDSLKQVPLAPRANKRVLSITVAGRTDLGAGVAFNSTLRSAIPGLRTELVTDAVAMDITRAGVSAPGVSSSTASTVLDRLLRQADSADVVIVSSYLNITSATATASAPGGLIDLVNALVKRGRRPIIVGFGNPYLLQEIPGVPSYLVAWGPSVVSQQAAAQALLGRIPIQGRLPITIPAKK
jgi:beta-N-acetylhexosaminidase